MKQVRCPIREAISNIRKEGGYDSDDDSRVVTIGGGDESEIVYAEAEYRLTISRLEFARFEAKLPLFPLAIKWLDDHYSWMYGKSYVDLYHEIVEKTIRASIIGEQLGKIFSAMESIEGYCADVIGRCSAEGASISAFARPKLSDDYLRHIVKYPKALREVNTLIINYCKSFRVSGREKDKLIEEIYPPEIPPELETFPVEKRAKKKKSLTLSVEVVAHAKEFAECEAEILTYVAAVEKYHRSVIDSHAGCLLMLMNMAAALLAKN